MCKLEDEDDPDELRLIVTTINLISLILFHKKEQAKSLPESCSKKLVVRMCNLDVAMLLEVNGKVEASLVFLMAVVKPFVNNTYVGKFRQTVLSLFAHSTASPKMNFNLLKLITEFAENIPVPEATKWKLVENIKERTCRQNIEIQSLAYTVLLKLQRPKDAVSLFY